MKNGLRILTALCLFALPAGAAEKVFQNGLDGYEDAADTTLSGAREPLRDKNFGGQETLRVAGVAKGGMRLLGLLRFGDLTGPGRLPENARVQSAWLELYKVGEPKDSGQYGKVREHDRYLMLYPMLTPWQAGTAAGEMDPQGATFSSRGSEDGMILFWGNANQIEEGPVPGIDYREEPEARVLLMPNQNDLWMRWNVRNLVEEWVRNPASNHGVLLLARSFYVGSYFASCDAEDPSLRPRLVVEFSQ